MLAWVYLKKNVELDVVPYADLRDFKEKLKYSIKRKEHFKQTSVTPI